MIDFLSVFNLSKDSWKFVLDLSSHRADKRKNLFESVVDPAYRKMTEVHEDYMRFINDALASIPHGDVDSQYVVDGNGMSKEVTEREAYYLSCNVLHQIKLSREMNWHTRVGVRSEAEALFKRVAHHEVRTFFSAIVLYFVEPHNLGGKNGQKYLLKSSSLFDGLPPENALRSPTSHYKQMLPANNPKDLRDDLWQTKSELEGAWVILSQAYSEAKASLLT